MAQFPRIAVYFGVSGPPFIRNMSARIIWSNTFWVKTFLICFGPECNSLVEINNNSIINGAQYIIIWLFSRFHREKFILKNVQKQFYWVVYSLRCSSFELVSMMRHEASRSSVVYIQGAIHILRQWRIFVSFILQNVAGQNSYENLCHFFKFDASYMNSP